MIEYSQSVVNVTPEQAMQYGADMFQLYYAGIKVGFSVHKGQWKMTEGPRVVKSGEGNPKWTGFLLGTYNPVSEKVAFWDCWESDGIELLGSPYRDRIILMRKMQPYLFDWCSLVNSYRIADFVHVWDGQVINGSFLGVIFRKSKDPATSPRLVCIKNPEPRIEKAELNPQ